MKESNHPDQELLKMCQANYEKNGILSKWVEPNEHVPFHTLVVQFESVGNNEQILHLDLNFLPQMEQAASDGLYILQSFVTLLDHEIQGTRHNDLFRFVAKVNTQLPLGAFGLFEDTNILYYKYNSIINMNLDFQYNVQYIDQQNGMILHIQQLFLDAFIQLAHGEITVEQAIKNSPLL